MLSRVSRTRPPRGMSLNSCLDKKERCLNFRQPDEVQNTPCLAVRILWMSSYYRQKKPHYIVLCFLDHSAVLGHDFQNTPCPAVLYF